MREGERDEETGRETEEERYIEKERLRKRDI